MAYKVWQALGNPRHYMEPFFGSGAVLLARQGYNPDKHIETICDADGFIANVWRSIQADPQTTAHYADWPVNHADLNARREWLRNNNKRLLENLISDPEWYDAKAAGWWIWGASCWIGAGLTHPDAKQNAKKDIGIPRMTEDAGVVAKSLRATSVLPHLSDTGLAVNAMGLRNTQNTIDGIPSLTRAGRGVFQSPTNINIINWFSDLAARLRYVRVVCGDWSRICGGNWQDGLNGEVGIFFDPPYSAEDRAAVYNQESFSVAHHVREWALERGAKPTYRIVLAGYIEEHESLLAHGWRAEQWKTNGGYGNQGGSDTQGKKNKCREALFYSPHCLQNTLF